MFKIIENMFLLSLCWLCCSSKIQRQKNQALADSIRHAPTGHTYFSPGLWQRSLSRSPQWNLYRWSRMCSGLSSAKMYVTPWHINLNWLPKLNSSHCNMANNHWLDFFFSSPCTYWIDALVSSYTKVSCGTEALGCIQTWLILSSCSVLFGLWP